MNTTNRIKIYVNGVPNTAVNTAKLLQYNNTNSFRSTLKAAFNGSKEANYTLVGRAALEGFTVSFSQVPPGIKRTVEFNKLKSN